MRWKKFLSVTLFGLTLVLIFGGIQWVIEAKTTEASLAFVTALATLIGGWQTREDKKEQAKDKAEILSNTKNDGDLTRNMIINTRSAEYGLDLLQNSEWQYNPTKEQFYCTGDTDWTIIQERETYEKFYEPWIDNLNRGDKEVVIYRTILMRNNTEIKDIRFIDLDGHRITMPLPQKYGSDIFYYCEGGFEHLMFNIVRRLVIMYHRHGLELVNLARQANIEWRECETRD